MNSAIPKAGEMMSFRSKAVETHDLNKVDIQNRIIKSVILAQPAEAIGHGVHLEKSFLEKMVQITTAKGGQIKVNFEHNYSNMGKQLGMMKNIRLSGTKVIGDLHIYAAADLSPTHPNMGTFVLSLAQENPAVLNCSIKFIPDYYYGYDADGTKVKVSNYEVWNNQYSGGKKKYYVAIKDLKSVDLVEEGAVTETLFSAKPKATMSLWQKLLGTTPPKTTPATEELSAQIEEAQVALQEGIAQCRSLQAALDESNAHSADLSIQLAAALAKVEALEKIPAATHTNGDTSQDGNAEFTSAFNDYFAQKTRK